MTALEVELGTALDAMMRFHNDYAANEGEETHALQEQAAKVGAQVGRALARYQTVVKTDEEDRDMLREKIKGDVDAERKGWR